ncbi:hypothetical protein YQE_07780, partial [Dendroctonus ponderosae]
MEIINRSTDGGQFVTDYRQPGYLRLLRWGCADECEYQCMWSTVEKFQENQLNIPQFYGKAGAGHPGARLHAVLPAQSLHAPDAVAQVPKRGAGWRPLALALAVLRRRLLQRLDLVGRFPQSRPALDRMAGLCGRIFHHSGQLLCDVRPVSDFLESWESREGDRCDCRVLPHVLGAVFPKRPQLVLLVSLGFLLFFLKHAAYLSRGRSSNCHWLAGVERKVPPEAPLRPQLPALRDLLRVGAFAGTSGQSALVFRGRLPRPVAFGNSAAPGLHLQVRHGRLPVLEEHGKAGPAGRD